MPSLAVPITTLCLLVSACGFMMIGPPAETMHLTSQNDAEENLKAIRAMLADQQRRSAPSSDELLDEPPTPLPPNDSKQLSEPHSAVDFRKPFFQSATRNLTAPAKLPWTPPAISSAISRSTPPDRAVPAYTIPAPVGPAFMGVIRCVPDGMGGQRCAAR